MHCWNWPPPPSSKAAIFFILPLHVEKKRASFLSALVQDTFACHMLCPQSTCNLIARRTTITEDKDADCGVMDGLLHQDLNCQWGLLHHGPKQFTVNCPRVSCRLVWTHRVTWLIWSDFCSLWIYRPEKVIIYGRQNFIGVSQFCLKFTFDCDVVLMNGFPRTRGSSAFMWSIFSPMRQTVDDRIVNPDHCPAPGDRQL